MYKAFHDYVPRMATPEMTAELEQDMDQIAAGETSKDEVLRVSREMLHSTTTDLTRRRTIRPRPRTSARTSRSRSGPGWTRTSSSARARSARRPGEARGRLAEPPAHHRAQGRQADVRLRGLEPRRPRLAGLLPGQRPAPRPRLRALAARGALLDLRRDAAAHGQGLPRPALEALPQRRLPVDGRDAAEARRSGRRRGRRRRRRRTGRRPAPKTHRPTPTPTADRPRRPRRRAKPSPGTARTKRARSSARNK